MPFTRMLSALQTAAIEHSSATQFAFSRVDFQTFIRSSHHQKQTSSASPPSYTFAGVTVTSATCQQSPSYLHVLGSRPIFTNPIAV